MGVIEDNKRAHLRYIRETVLGLSQVGFTTWLFEHGETGRHKEPYTVQTVAAWENGRRNIPASVLKVIHDNVAYNGQKFRLEYLNGEDNIPTQAFLTPEIKKAFSRIKDVTDFAELVIPGIAVYMTKHGYDFSEINDLQHFSNWMQGQVKIYMECVNPAKGLTERMINNEKKHD